MMTESRRKLVESVRRELDGIECTDLERGEFGEDGWWETSTGCQFGEKKLAAVIKLIEEYTGD